jgi:hypothetical protein
MHALSSLPLLFASSIHSRSGPFRPYISDYHSHNKTIKAEGGWFISVSEVSPPVRQNAVVARSVQLVDGMEHA